ncbi:hypothetical protein HPP92_011133 [Vanilla planifolia]|uniref:Uncharacterized protein n=1 Tax=Vanilla planifolia TaxID=51239 RepID=A0A835R289_VANPL|nr:hypothetical protein HPP92_011396 [Vanilla planifolia]KAG0483049.1 hypothetical protein HPP92_011133 [Vanilla planifolia]
MKQSKMKTTTTRLLRAHEKIENLIKSRAVSYSHEAYSGTKLSKVNVEQDPEGKHANLHEEKQQDSSLELLTEHYFAQEQNEQSLR